MQPQARRALTGQNEEREALPQACGKNCRREVPKIRSAKRSDSRVRKVTGRSAGQVEREALSQACGKNCRREVPDSWSAKRSHKRVRKKCGREALQQACGKNCRREVLPQAREEKLEIINL